MSRHPATNFWSRDCRTKVTGSGLEVVAQAASELGCRRLFLGLRRLICHLRMLMAVRPVLLAPTSTEREVLVRRISDRPLAHVRAEREDDRRSRRLIDVLLRSGCGTCRHRLARAPRSGRSGSWRARRLEIGPLRLRGRRPAGEAQAMHLADDCVPRHPTELRGDL